MHVDDSARSTTAEARVRSHAPRPAIGRTKWLPAAAAAALSILLYAVTLVGTFVYDDLRVVHDDPRLQSPGGWVDYLRQPYMVGAPDPLWRPLPSLSYALQGRIHGQCAWPFHAVNIALHAAVSALVALLALRLTGRIAVAWLAGLLFAAHPVHVEAVAYIVGRAESMCALGVVGGLLLLVEARMTTWRAVAITGCFALAVLSKEHGILLPAMILAALLAQRYVVGRPLYEDPKARQSLLLLCALLCFGILAYIAYRESIMHLAWEKFFLRWTVNPIVRSHGIDRVLVPFSVLGRYLEILFLPLRPSPDYGAAITDYRIHWAEAQLYLGLATTAAWIVTLIVAIRRRAAAVVVLLLCLAISYSLISNTVYLIGIVMGERLIYVPSIFLSILAAMALDRLPKRVLWTIAPLILGLLCVRTATYAWRWNDPLRLYSLCRQEHPKSVALRILEGEERISRGDLDGAEQVLAVGRQLVPESVTIWAVSSRVATLQDRTQDAQEYAVRAFDLDLNPPQLPRRWPATTQPAAAPAH